MKFLSRRSTNAETTNSRIFRAAITIGYLTLFVKVAVALKELLVAKSFGRSDSLDAFLVAYLLPTFVIGLLMGALGSAFIPVFVEAKEKQGVDAAQRVLSNAMFLCIVVLTSFAILIAMLAPLYLPYLASGFARDKLHLTQTLLYALLPFVLFGGLAVFISAVLNASEKFALPAVIPLVSPLAIIVFIELGAKTWGAYSLAGGTVVGSFLETALLALGLRTFGMRITPGWTGASAEVRAIVTQCGPMLGATFLMSGTWVVDQSMAAMLSGGSVAALSYANKVVSAIVAIGALGLSTAALSYFSKMVAQNDWKGCRHTLRRYSVLVIVTTVPLTACLMIFSEPLIRLLFERGAFAATDTKLVSWVLVCYLIQIPFYVWGILFVKFLSSIRRSDVLMYVAVVNLILDVVLNLLLMRIWGIAGIALSTSIVYIVSFLLLSTWSIKLLAEERFSVSASAAANRAAP